MSGLRSTRALKKLVLRRERQIMSLHINSEQIGDVAVLQCVGRIVRGEALHLIKNAVTSLTQMRVIVLDLSGVEMLDAGGLGTLVFLHRWTRDNGIQLKLVNPSTFAQEMLQRTGLTCVLRVSSVDDAVEILTDGRFETWRWLSFAV
jgi:anti-anti-sigma factor